MQGYNPNYNNCSYGVIHKKSSILCNKLDNGGKMKKYKIIIEIEKEETSVKSSDLDAFVFMVGDMVDAAEKYRGVAVTKKSVEIENFI
jgi:hypothetical protein